MGRDEELWFEMPFSARERAHRLHHKLLGRVASRALALPVLRSKGGLQHEPLLQQLRSELLLEQVHRLCPFPLWWGLPLRYRLSTGVVHWCGAVVCLEVAEVDSRFAAIDALGAQ